MLPLLILTLLLGLLGYMRRYDGNGGAIDTICILPVSVPFTRYNRYITTQGGNAHPLQPVTNGTDSWPVPSTTGLSVFLWSPGDMDDGSALSHNLQCQQCRNKESKRKCLTTTGITNEKKHEPDVPPDACCGCSRRCVCMIGVILILLMIIAAAIVCVAVLALPARAPESRNCITPDNVTGFLCDDRRTCLLPSQVCNSAMDCGNGEDEATSMCSNLPNNLPGYLIFRCGNPQFWIYSNLKCNNINNCGDCSDETQLLASCPPCPDNWWPCTPVLYQYCNCIPKSLCRNGVQDCVNWSDEYVCP